MAEPIPKRSSRQPHSPEEVAEIIRIKRYRQKKAIELFKKTKTFKILNVFNVVCILIYSELIFAFMGQCNYSTHYFTGIKVYYGHKITAGKKIFSSAIINGVSGKTYEVSVQDTCNAITNSLASKIALPFYVGSDWLLQKDIKIQLDGSTAIFFIKRSSPLLFISIMQVIVTFVLFGYNMNEVRYSLKVVSFINSLALFYFLLV